MKYLVSRLIGLIFALLVVSVSVFAQTSNFVADFSSMTVGTIRPIRVEGHNGGWYYNDQFSVATYSSSSASSQTFGKLRFSTSEEGTYADTIEMPLPLDGYGNGTTAVFYMKAIAPITTITVVACSATTTCTPPGQYFSITSAANPTGLTLDFDDYTYYELGVGTAQKVDGHITGSTPNIGSNVQIYSNSTAVVFSTGVNGPYSAVLTFSTSVGSTGAGQFGFYVKGMSTTLGASQLPQIFACFAGNLCGSTPGIKIYNAASVKFETYVDTSMPTPNVPLDNNPNVGGGLRIFPEKKVPTETVSANKRRNVTVVAKLNEPVPNKQIEFRVFDIDDISTDDSIVDPNGNSGNDNRSSDHYLGSSGYTTRTAYTDANGEARIILAVGQQPGDNYRVAATFKRPYAASHRVLTDATVIGGEVYYNNSLIPEGTANNVQPGVATKRLTVWRRLHIERDSMGTVSGNLVSGSISAVINERDFGTTGITRLALSVTPSGASAISSGRFMSGRIYIFSEMPNSPNGYFFVYKTGGSSVWVAGVVPQIMVNSEFTLYDDDDFNGDDHADTWHGDNGEDVPQPNNGWMQDSDNPSLNKFAPAYIRPTYDLTGNDNNLPFVANVPKANLTQQFPTNSEFASLGKFDNVGYRADTQFWVAYLLEAYQVDAPQDDDPKDDGIANHWGGYLGICIRSYGGFIFAENIGEAYGRIFYPEGHPSYEFYSDTRYTPVHEAAHLLNTENDDGGFMSKDDPVFSNVSLNYMRSTVVPTSGQN